MGIAAAIAGSAAIAGGASIIGSSEQAGAANKAANTQLSMYNQTRSDLQPYMQTGNAALSQLSQLFGLGTPGSGGASGAAPGAANPFTAAITGQTPGFGAATPGAANPGISPTATSTLENTPGYQFLFNQGVQSLDRSAASRGLTLSGAQLQDAQSFGQQSAAANAWNPYVSQLNTLGSLGENAGAQVGNQGTQAAANAGSAQIAAGANVANGINSTANTLNSSLLQYAQMNNATDGSVINGIGQTGF